MAGNINIIPNNEIKQYQNSINVINGVTYLCETFVQMIYGERILEDYYISPIGRAYNIRGNYIMAQSADNECLNLIYKSW
jgi:hypothetical protein